MPITKLTSNIFSGASVQDLKSYSLSFCTCSHCPGFFFICIGWSALLFFQFLWPLSSYINVTFYTSVISHLSFITFSCPLKVSFRMCLVRVLLPVPFMPLGFSAPPSFFYPLCIVPTCPLLSSMLLLFSLPATGFEVLYIQWKNTF